MWKGNGKTTILLFSLKGIDIFHQAYTIVAQHFNSILFHKSGPPNKQHAYQSINGNADARVIATVTEQQLLKIKSIIS
jgi:hypothetical protein